MATTAALIESFNFWTSSAHQSRSLLAFQKQHARIFVLNVFNDLCCCHTDAIYMNLSTQWNINDLILNDLKWNMSASAIETKKFVSKYFYLIFFAKIMIVMGDGFYYRAFFNLTLWAIHFSIGHYLYYLYEKNLMFY